MHLILLYGLPAVGKLTVARELARRSGWPLFHNHLTVDLVASVFDFGSPPFVELREHIWTKVITRARQEGSPGLIFTFSPERTVRQEFIDRLVSEAKAAGQLWPIELVCPGDEIERRISLPSRAATQKLRSVEFFRQLCDDGAFDFPHMPPPWISIDTGSLTPGEAAERIWNVVVPDS